MTAHRDRWKVCARKRAYPTYQAARSVVASMRENAWDDPTLHVFQCPDGHFHVGHATGEEAARLRKRAEKMRLRAASGAPRGTVTG